MSIDEAVIRYGISPGIFSQIARDGIVSARKKHGSWVFTNDLALDQYIAGNAAMQKIYKRAQRRKKIEQIAQSFAPPRRSRSFRRDMIIDPERDAIREQEAVPAL